MSDNKTVSVISHERVVQFLRSRYNPLVGFDPQRLVQFENDWDAGHLRSFALAMERIKETDDVLKGVSGKREKGPSVRGWEILTVDDSDEAKRDQEALKFFYDNLTVTNAIDENERGGAAMLIRQMQQAVAFRYSVHEIMWQPSGRGVTATLKHIPLHFFENTTGRLRFLQTEGSWSGVDLEEGGWMVTVGDFLMRACARAYLYKHLPLRDWLIYCGRHGMPGIAGKTTAQPDSPQWQQMEDAVEAFAAEFAAVFSAGDSIEKIDMTAQGTLPYPQLVERMDRAMAALWRGNDLSTMSQGSGPGTGASVQGDETEILVASDALMVSEAAQHYLDKQVIYYTTGELRRPMAYFAIKGVTKSNTDQDLKVDRQLFDMGVPLSRQSIADRYSRPLPQDEADTLLKPAGAPAMPGEVIAANTATEPAPASPAQVNDRLVAQAVADTLQVRANWLAPFFDHLEAAAKDGTMSDEDFLAALEEAANAMPELLDAAHIEEAAKPVRALLETSLVNALAAKGEATPSKTGKEAQP